MAVPRLIEWGPGWLVMAAPGVAIRPPVGRLRRCATWWPCRRPSPRPRRWPTRGPADPFGADLSRLLAAGVDVELPPPLAELRADPAPLLAALDGLPVTLVHGDAWRGNLVWASGCPVWIGWEECSRAPAVADLATWSYGSAFVPRTWTPERDLRAYGVVDRRAVEAAFLLLFSGPGRAGVE